MLAGILLFTTVVSYSQEDPEKEQVEKRDFTQNKFSINAFNLVTFGIMEITYERVISENSTRAVEGFYHPDKDNYIDGAYYKSLSLTGKYKVKIHLKLWASLW